MGLPKNLLCIVALWISMVSPPSLISHAQTPDEISPFELPPLQSDEDLLRYLNYIHDHLPRLFEDAAKYDVDLFKMLEEQRTLVTRLREDPIYVARMQNRQTLHFATAALESEVVSKNYQIKSSAVDDWKRRLTHLLDGYKPSSTISDHVVHESARLERLLGKKTSQGMFIGLLQSIHPDLLRKNPRFKDGSLKSLESKLQYLEEIVPETAPAEFRAADYGLRGQASKAEILQTYKKLAQLESEIESVKRAGAALLFLTEKNLETASEQSIKAMIAGLTPEDLQWLSDEDAIKPLLEKQGFKKQALQQQISFVRNHAAEYLSQVDVSEVKVKGGVQLLEAPPGVGIFRGCSGGDCSSQFSFPYPNDPHERVYFLSNEHGRLKGYVTGTIVEVNGKKAFYVITMSGSKINSVETRLAFRTLMNLKSELGVDLLVVPESSRLDALINHSAIRSVYQELTAGPAVPIRYLDPGVRSKIENFKSGYNTANYDKAATNTRGHVVDEKALQEMFPDVKLTKTEATAKWAYFPKKPLNRTDLYLFAIDLKHSGRKEELKRVLDYLGTSLDNFNEFESHLTNAKKLKIADYEKTLATEVKKLFEQAKIPSPTDAQIERLYNYGYVNSSDLFALENRERTTQYFLNLIRELEDDADDLLKEVYLPLVQHADEIPLDSKLMRPFLEHLASNSSVAIGHFSTTFTDRIAALMKDSSHPLSDLAFRFLLRRARHSNIIPPVLFEELFKRIAAGKTDILDELPAAWRNNQELLNELYEGLRTGRYRGGSVKGHLIKYDPNVMKDERRFYFAIADNVPADRLLFMKAALNRGDIPISPYAWKTLIKTAERLEGEAKSEFTALMINQSQIESPDLDAAFDRWIRSEVELTTTNPAIHGNPPLLKAIKQVKRAPLKAKWAARALEVILQYRGETEAPRLGELFHHFAVFDTPLHKKMLAYLQDHPKELTVEFVNHLANPHYGGIDKKGHVKQIHEIIQKTKPADFDEALQLYSKDKAISEVLYEYSRDHEGINYPLVRYFKSLHGHETFTPEQFRLIKDAVGNLPFTYSSYMHYPTWTSYPAGLGRLMISEDAALRKEAIEFKRRVDYNSLSAASHGDKTRLDELAQLLVEKKYPDFLSYYANGAKEVWSTGVREMLETVPIDDRGFHEAFLRWLEAHPDHNHWFLTNFFKNYHLQEDLWIDFMKRNEMARGYLLDNLLQEAHQKGKISAGLAEYYAELRRSNVDLGKLVKIQETDELLTRSGFSIRKKKLIFTAPAAPVAVAADPPVVAKCDRANAVRRVLSFFRLRKH